MSRNIFTKCMAQSQGKACFANNVLLARKLVEKGVRFVQLFDWGWDAHGDNAGNALNLGIVNKYRSVDKAMTALILDLKQRGLAGRNAGGMGRRVWPYTNDGKQEWSTESI